MAHHASAKKRIRQIERRTAVNRNRVGAIRTSIKKVEAAIASGDQAAAREALKVAQPVIHGGVTKGVLHRNTAARRLSRLSARIKAMQS
ncbi:MAG: 30S ribosomal protein S20 [Hyphomicrobiales bacterium]|nr:30S ribosomal protein S20 [Hyphomicrobiales bacterium]MCP5370131.1 30S ribosomal protein S20 [Hyphomicrobiales bacterium]